VTPSGGRHPDESLNILGDEFVKKNSGHAITWKGGDGASGDGSL